MPGPGSATSPRTPLPPASIAISTGPPGPWRTAFVTSSVTISSARQRSSSPTPLLPAATRNASRAAAGAWVVAGSSREIDATFGPYPDHPPLLANARANDPLHLATVGAALSGLHHR